MKTVSRQLASWILLALLLSVSVTPSAGRQRPSHPRREAPPRAAPLRPFQLPIAREVKLENGLTLLMVEDGRSPIVTLELAVQAGSASDPPDQPGLAEATAELLIEGAGSRSSEDLARTIETLGAQADSFVTEDYSGVSAAVISENAERLVDVLADVVLDPTFPEREVDLYKSNRLADLKIQRQNPAFLAMDHFNRIIYGSHPYAVVAPTPDAISRLNRGHVEGFYRAHYSPKSAVLVVVGDFASTEIEKRLASRFDDWRGSPPEAREYPKVPEPGPRRIYLIDRPGSEQADILLGNIAIPRTDPDYFPLLTANAILGAGASSRLFLTVREQRGFSYDVYSEVRAHRMSGIFFAAAQSRPEVTVPTIQLMIAEIRRMQARLVPEHELQSAKNYINGVYSLSLSTHGGVAERLVHAHMLGLGTPHLQHYRERVEAVTAAQVREAARRHMLADMCSIVVVGDATGLRRRLRRLGPVVSVQPHS